jgi:hypothetical protein
MQDGTQSPIVHVALDTRIFAQMDALLRESAPFPAYFFGYHE